MDKLQLYLCYLINFAAHTARHPRWLEVQVAYRFFNVSDDIMPSAKLLRQQADKFIGRTARHIRTVNYFANLYRTGLQFPDHDKSKLFNLVESYEMSLLVNDLCNKKLLSGCHQATSDHHPEFWHKIWMMPNIKVVEMVLDWRAMSAERIADGNESIKYDDVMAFYTEKALLKYKFPKRQRKLIERVIQKTDPYNKDAVRKIWGDNLTK